jgi:hypothetical protein
MVMQQNPDTGGIADADFRQLTDEVVAAGARLGVPGVAIGVPP